MQTLYAVTGSVSTYTVVVLPILRTCSKLRTCVHNAVYQKHQLQIYMYVGMGFCVTQTMPFVRAMRLKQDL
jgi:hypothetical protein